jgi:pimeloyl-ACP methyl ester carboxylesterase
MRVRDGIFGIMAAVLVASVCASASAKPLATIAMPAQVVKLPASRGRELEIRIWSADKPTAIIVFSAGGEGEPGKYGKLLGALAKKGMIVLAPVHADALARNDISGSGGINSFIARIEDLAIARGYAKTTYPDLPIVVMGHSFGSMMSSLAVGAATPAGPQSDPKVKALIAFSSPGMIQGVISPTSFQGIQKPVLVVTGDKDIVPGFVKDWRNHRALYDSSTMPGSALIVLRDGDHDFIAVGQGKRFDALIALTATFIQANGEGNAAARNRLSKIKLNGAAIERR